MNAPELLKAALTSTGFQYEHVLNGMPETAWDAHACQGGMSVREIVEHLCEVYTAFQRIARGEDYKWGSYKVDDHSSSHLLELRKKLRDEAVDFATSSSEDQVLQGAMDYLVLHDAYHVGQLALIRMNADPAWNPYSIYPD